MSAFCTRHASMCHLVVMDPTSSSLVSHLCLISDVAMQSSLMLLSY